MALAGLFAEFAEPLAGKHPFPAESIERLSALGKRKADELLPALRSAVAARSGASPAAPRDAPPAT